MLSLQVREWQDCLQTLKNYRWKSLGKKCERGCIFKLVRILIEDKRNLEQKMPSILQARTTKKTKEKIKKSLKTLHDEKTMFQHHQEHNGHCSNRTVRPRGQTSCATSALAIARTASGSHPCRDRSGPPIGWGWRRRWLEKRGIKNGKTVKKVMTIMRWCGGACIRLFTPRKGKSQKRNRTGRRPENRPKPKHAQ